MNAVKGKIDKLYEVAYAGIGDPNIREQFSTHLCGLLLMVREDERKVVARELRKDNRPAAAAFVIHGQSSTKAKAKGK